MSAYLVERVERHPLVDVRLRSQVTELHADGDRLAGVTLTDAGGATERRAGSRAVHLHRRRAAHRLGRRDRRTHRTRRLHPHRPRPAGRTGARPDGWPLDRDPLALETSVPGLFAAGDVRSGSTKRVAAAVGEGAMAVALVHRRLEELAIAAAG